MRLAEVEDVNKKTRIDYVEKLISQHNNTNWKNYRDKKFSENTSLPSTDFRITGLGMNIDNTW